jgi:hypothetical protein
MQDNSLINDTPVRSSRTAKLRAKQEMQDQARGTGKYSTFEFQNPATPSAYAAGVRSGALEMVSPTPVMMMTPQRMTPMSLTPGQPLPAVPNQPAGAMAKQPNMVLNSLSLTPAAQTQIHPPTALAAAGTAAVPGVAPTMVSCQMYNIDLLLMLVSFR